jgi:hypothetical protein
VPVIRAATGRGVRLLPGLTGGQALGLVATGLAAVALWRTAGPLLARASAAGTVSLLGAAYVLGRWPARPDGERLAVWLPRLLRAAVRGGLRAGAAVPGWDGLQDVRGATLRTDGGWSAVLDIEGADFLLRGAAATAGAQAAFRELLHALAAPAQFVVWTRAVRAEDRPEAWDPALAPAALRGIASAYAAFWAGSVAGRTAIRRTLLVLTAPPGAWEQAARQLATAAAAAEHALGRMGLRARRLDAAELPALLREAGGAGDLRVGPAAVGAWRVEGPHA